MTGLRFDLRDPPPGAAALRAEVRTFIAEHEHCWAPEVRARSWMGFDRDFTRAVGAKGWIGMCWPKQYGGAERSFLDRALKARIGEGIEFPVIDTMDLEARIHRAVRPGFFARLFGKKPETVSIRLADSRARYRLPRYRAHHALTDALATAELLQAQVAHRFAPDTPLRELWS